MVVEAFNGHKLFNRVCPIEKDKELHWGERGIKCTSKVTQKRKITLLQQIDLIKSFLQRHSFQRIKVDLFIGKLIHFHLSHELSLYVS